MWICKKKFSGILLLLLLLIPCFLSASAGTAEATLRLIKIERRNYQIDQENWTHLGLRQIAANAEREVGFAVTGQTGDSSNPLLLYLQVKLEQQSPSSTGNGSVYVNNEKWPLDEEKRLGIQFLPYMHSFPADYNSTYFPNFFKIKINDKEGARYRFYVMVRDASTNQLVAGNSFRLTVHEEQESDHPVIEVPSEANPSITSYFSGSTTLNVRALSNRAEWRRFYEWKLGYDNILPQYRDAIVEAVFDNPKSYETTLRIKTKYIDWLPDGGYIGYLTLYALNTYDYAVSKDIRFGVVINDADKIPTITYPIREVSILPGTSDFIGFGGKYISTWSCDTTALPGFIQNVRLKYNTVYSNTCTVHVTLSPDAKIDDTYELKVRASNSMNKKYADAKLIIKTIGTPEDYEDPIIDSDETISVIQGGSASAVFTGRYVKRWGYKGDMPSGIDDIKFNYGSNPNRCEVRVTANAEAAVTSSPLSLDIYAYNAAGEEISSPKKLYINILENDETAAPIIDGTAKEISVVPGGTAAVTFTGQHTRTWSWAKADGDDTNPDIVENIELNYLSNPARCEVTVTLHDGIKAGLTDVINIYAYNAVGKKIATPATLTVKVASTGDNEDPVIDGSERVSVIKGGTAKATFTGQHIRAWACGTFPEAIHAIELKPAANPNRCDVLVTAADKTEATSATVTIYACNAIGEVTSADLNVTIIDDRDHYDPVIDYNESVSVVAGGTARAVFTGKHINSWKYGNLPDEIKAVELNYAANPNRCDVLVTASSTAAAGAKTVTIYAYNEIGEETSADLSVTIINDSEKSKYNKPVIDGEKKSVSVAKGGTARVVFTGKNIRAWAYGNLPEGVKAIELNYAANPNKCEFLVTASSTAAAGAKTVTIYAYNAVGEVTDKTLTVNIIDDSEKDKYAKPVINNSGLSVNVVKGGTVYTSLSGSNITSWAYGNLPDGIKSLEFIYNNNPNKCTAAVTASSAAETGARTITIYAFNEIGEATSATLTVNVIASGSDYDDPTIDSDDLKDTINVVPGGKISVSFDATNIYGFAYSVIPNEIEYVDWYVNDTGTKGAFFITASSTAEVKSTLSFDVYGFNEIGEVSETATIKLTVVKDDGNKNPVTKKSESTIVVEPGEIIAAEFTSANAKNWDFNISELPNVVNAIDVSYDIDNPKTCEITIIVSANTSLSEAEYDNSASDVSSAANTNHSFKVYAYNEIGSMTSGDFTFTVSDSDSDTGSGKSSSSGCNSGMSGLTDLGVAGLLILIYYLTSRKLKN